MRKQNIQSSFLDAEVLMSAAINRPREFLYAHPEYEMTDEEIAKYETFIQRRASREPTAYITGKKEFYGLDFFVDKRVLIPRPETEKIAESAISIARAAEGRCMVIDVGTGSGCVIIAIAKALGDTNEYAAGDISESALLVARENAKRHGVLNRIAFFRGNLIDHILNLPLYHFGTIIVAANLPYITPSQYQTLEPEIVLHEPRGALLTPTDDPDYYYHALDKMITILSKKTNARIERVYETAKGV